MAQLTMYYNIFELIKMHSPQTLQ